MAVVAQYLESEVDTIHRNVYKLFFQEMSDNQDIEWPSLAPRNMAVDL